jgi:hypothetical protein
MIIYLLFVLQVNGAMKKGCGNSFPFEWVLLRPQLRDYNFDNLDWLHVLECYLSQYVVEIIILII